MDSFSTSGRRADDVPRQRQPRGAVSVKMHVLIFASLLLLMPKAMSINGVFFALLGAFVVQGILAIYKLLIPSLPAASDHHQSSLPEGVQFVLYTLPVTVYNIGDGDGFSAYVDTAIAIPGESANVPLEVQEMVIERTQARAARDYQKADGLRTSIGETGYKMITISGKEILAKKYRIRMRGVDAPELQMSNGEESKNALLDLIGEKRVTIYVYGQDKFGRYVGDIYCDNMFVQERMLKSGHVWHFKKYDKRPEFAQWEREARAARRGIFASENPQKPWDWRRDQRNANTPVYEWR